MTDELNIPQVPEAKPEDPEDVSWALSTAEAMWARGDHAEGIKWVRRAAEAASEAENDGRALELAKAAADLQGLLARRSLADKGSDRSLPAAKPLPSVTAKIAAPSGPISAVPPTNRSVPPIGKAGSPSSSRSVPSVAPKAPSTAAAAKSGRSIPPIPLPSKTSSPPPANTAPASIPPQPTTSRASKAPPRPHGTAAAKPDDKEKKKGRGRKSRENLEAEARAAGVLNISDTDEVVALDDNDAVLLSPKPRDRESDATVITNRAELEKQKKTARTHTLDWDASPTQNTVGALGEEPEERKTAVGGPPRSIPPSGSPSGVTATAARSSQAPASIPPRGAEPRRATPSIIPHDDSIQTCQAVRVVVWRDAQGVHVAPAGTVVSAIKIDAVLVALEPTADLTAWLSRKDR